MRLTQDELNSIQARLGNDSKPTEAAKRPKKNKYNAQRVTVDGINFHSKVEADYYAQLVLMKKAGEIKTFFRQVPIFLGGRKKYIVDFMIVENGGVVRYVDIKGFETDLFKLKKSIAEEVHGIKIEVIYIRKRGRINGRSKKNKKII